MRIDRQVIFGSRKYRNWPQSPISNQILFPLKNTLLSVLRPNFSKNPRLYLPCLSKFCPSMLIDYWIEFCFESFLVWCGFHDTEMKTHKWIVNPFACTYFNGENLTSKVIFFKTWKNIFELICQAQEDVFRLAEGIVGALLWFGCRSMYSTQSFASKSFLEVQDWSVC